MRRIVVVGTTGSGKTTLACALSARLGLPHTELDALYWQPDWTPVEPDVMSERVTALVQGEAWVVDGNYSKIQPLILARADTLIWLDYPLHINLVRLLKRTTRRIITHERLWTGCRETLRKTMSRDSIFVWAWKTHAKNRVKYLNLARSAEISHVDFVHLRTPLQTARWLESFETVY